MSPLMPYLAIAAALALTSATMRSTSMSVEPLPRGATTRPVRGFWPAGALRAAWVVAPGLGQRAVVEAVLTGADHRGQHGLARSPEHLGRYYADDMKP